VAVTRKGAAAASGRARPSSRRDDNDAMRDTDSTGLFQANTLSEYFTDENHSGHERTELVPLDTNKNRFTSCSSLSLSLSLSSLSVSSASSNNSHLPGIRTSAK
jgi:hypothetical protein